MSTRKNKTKQTFERIQTFKYKLILEGACVGLLTGLVVSLFRKVLEEAEFLRDSVLGVASKSLLITVAALLTLFFLAGVTLFVYRKVPLCSGSGIPQVKGELKGQIEQNWWQILVAKFVGGVCAIGAGLSLGREGPSIQLGAMVGKGFSKLTRRLRTEEKMLMTCGAGAGLAGAFCAPLAGVVFSLEELHKNFSTEILLSTMAATVTSDFVASYLFGLKPVFDLHVEGRLPLDRYWMVILLGLILGVFGVLYNKLTDIGQNLYDKLNHKAVKVGIAFTLIIPFAWFYPIVLGSGHQLVGRIAEGKFVLSALVILLIFKLLFSICSFASGVPGGIFLPLLVLGAIIGGAFADFLSSLAGYEEVYLANFVILGMTGYFSAIVRAPITGVILITEMTGDFKNFLSLAIVALVAYLIADILKGQPIYDQLLDKMISKDESYGVDANVASKKVLLESVVYYGALMDGRTIEEMLLPPGCLVVSIQRDNKEIVPSGGTVLKGGDTILILCAESYISRVEDKLWRICKTVRQ